MYIIGKILFIYNQFVESLESLHKPENCYLKVPGGKSEGIFKVIKLVLTTILRDFGRCLMA